MSSVVHLSLGNTGQGRLVIFEVENKLNSPHSSPLCIFYRLKKVWYFFSIVECVTGKNTFIVEQFGIRLS